MVRYSKMSLRHGLDKIGAGINLYVFAGIGVSYFKPKALDSFDGSERFVDNKNLSLSIPLGFGLKYPLNPTTNIGFELSGSFTTTDYIDGFVPESSDSKDLYYFSVIYVSYKIKSNRRRNKRRF